MNTLVFRPGRLSLRYSGFTDSHRHPVLLGHVPDVASISETPAQMRSALTRVVERFESAAEAPPALIAVRAAFGGEEFPAPVLLDESVLDRLVRQIPAAPLHQPFLVSILRSLQETLPGVPVVVAFDTSFFVPLPQRESHYALDGSIVSGGGGVLRRFGYSGLYHASACRAARRSLSGDALGQSTRLLSVCLEPRPELAAVLNMRPVMVTTGVTPLEGLPGERVCGEIDPSLVLTFCEQMKWGPEKVDAVLTRESGLCGLLGVRISLAEVLASDDLESAPARELLRYRIRLACGMGIAAMGGVDAIVFSGRYVDAGMYLSTALTQMLNGTCLRADEPPVRVVYYRESLDRILADECLAAWLRMRSISGSGNRVAAEAAASDRA